MTTRTTSEEKHTAADDALRYLRHLNSLAPADNSGLTKALQFRDTNSSRSKRARTRHSDINSDGELEDPGRIRSNYAKKDSLFSNAEDFWAVIGWAFNCSVAHENRWSRWKLWLEFILDVLEDDLDARHRQARISPEDRDKILSKSLLAHYLAPFVDQGRNPKRRIMRAILADGTQPSLNLFPQIYPNETLLPKSKQERDAKLGSKRSLDLDQGDFGDYFDSDSDSATTPPQKTSRRPTTNTAHTPPKNPSTFSSHGGPTSLSLRRRLLTLLSTLSAAAPNLFLEIEDLFDLYTEFLRPLPLPIFSYFILPQRTTSNSPKPSRQPKQMDPYSLTSLIRMLLRPLLTTSAPTSNANILTASSFATDIAPFTANTSGVGDNARVGVCVEGLLRLLWAEGMAGLKEEGVRTAVEQGIKRREERCGDVKDKRKSVGGDGREGWEVLRETGERMRGMLMMI
jgi:hypothetical protein